MEKNKQYSSTPDKFTERYKHFSSLLFIYSKSLYPWIKWFSPWLQNLCPYNSEHFVNSLSDNKKTKLTYSTNGAILKI